MAKPRTLSAKKPEAPAKATQPRKRVASKSKESGADVAADETKPKKYTASKTVVMNKAGTRAAKIVPHRTPKEKARYRRVLREARTKHARRTGGLSLQRIEKLLYMCGSDLLLSKDAKLEIQRVGISFERALADIIALLIQQPKGQFRTIYVRDGVRSTEMCTGMTVLGAESERR